MKKFFIILSIAIVSFTMMSCAPQSKEAYFSNLEKIITEVTAEKSEFSADDWDALDDEIEKYTSEYYDKFEAEFTVEEKAQIVKLLSKYAYHRSVFELKNMYNTAKEYDIQKDFEDLKDYMENDLKDDAEEAGEAVEELIDDLGDSFDEFLDKLQKDILK